MILQQDTTLQGVKYIIKQVLGQGGFGITYLAENTMLEGKVAIKEFFFKEYCSRDEETSHVSIPIEGNKAIVNRFKQKFIKEARTIFKLNHPNIVRIHDIFEENGTAYYVMDYIEGESLGEMVNRRGSIPEAEAVGYIKEVGSALEYIHGKSINHLDIKPSNIMKRQEDGPIIVIDFGVAKQYDAETEEGTTTTPVGISKGYSPTEQYRINGVQTFSPQSDVYALAATLFKLLTGVTPPEADVVREEGLPVEELRAKGVSESVISAIVNAMKSRRERTQSIQELLIQLDGVEKANDNYQRVTSNGSHNYDNETPSVLESNKSSVTNQGINKSLRNNISQYNYIQTNKDNSFIAFYKRNIDGTFLESIGALILFVIIMIAFASITAFVVFLVFIIFDIEYSNDKSALGKIEYDTIASGFIAIVSSALLVLINKFLGKVGV